MVFRIANTKLKLVKNAALRASAIDVDSDLNCCVCNVEGVCCAGRERDFFVAVDSCAAEKYGKQVVARTSASLKRYNSVDGCAVECSAACSSRVS